MTDPATEADKSPGDAAGRAAPIDRQFFRLAIEACPGGIVVVDSAGTIAFVNREIERLFGYRREELLGRPVEFLLPENLRGTSAEQHNGFSLSSGVRPFGSGRDFVARHKDGSAIAIEVALNATQIGPGLMAVCAISDISQRKRVEQLQDDFVSMVSHELRTPMTSIAASLSLLHASTAAGLPKPAAHLLEIAHANCQRLILLVNDILDIKKLETGKVAFRFARCKAPALLKQAVDAIRSFADDYDVQIVTQTCAADIELLVDPDRFVQVITNLLSNAVKFSPAGRNVTVALERRGGLVRITVRDHGSGIPAEFKPHVFEKFAQASTPVEHQKNSTGLGLSIVREIVMRLHGEVGFDGAPGGGTVFFVDLPDANQIARRYPELIDEAPAPLLHARSAGRAS